MRYKFEIIPGRECNFRCTYCYEQARSDSYGPELMDPTVMDQAYSFVKAFLQVHPYDTVTICVFGGEPACYMTQMYTLLSKFKDLPVSFNILTNGTLVTNHRDSISKWSQMYPDRMKIHISFDWDLQNIQRHPGTEDENKDNIIWLQKTGITWSTNTIFTLESLPMLYSVFSNYRFFMDNNFGKILQPFRFGIDYYNIRHWDISWDACLTMAQALRDFLELNPEQRKYIKYNYGRPESGISCRVHNCGFGWRVIGCVDTDGSFYGCQCTAYHKNRNLFRLGHISEGFDILYCKVQNLLSILPPAHPMKCKECKAFCNWCPVKAVDNDLHEFGGMPGELHCQVRHLITNAIDGMAWTNSLSL